MPDYADWWYADRVRYLPLVLMCCSPALVDSPKTLVRNPGFEAGSEAWMPARDPQGSALDSAVAHSGKSSERLTTLVNSICSASARTSRIFSCFGRMWTPITQPHRSIAFRRAGTDLTGLGVTMSMG